MYCILTFFRFLATLENSIDMESLDCVLSTCIVFLS
jgi:hypothetical protein